MHKTLLYWYYLSYLCMIDKTLKYIILYGVPILIDVVESVAVQKRLSPLIMNMESNVWETLDACQPANISVVLSLESSKLFQVTMSERRVNNRDNIIHGSVGFLIPTKALILHNPEVIQHPTYLTYPDLAFCIELRSKYTDIIVERTTKRHTNHRIQPILNLINEKDE